MSPDQYAELEALTRTCRMCGKTCPVGYLRGHICWECDHALLVERAIDESRTTEEPL